VSRSEELTTRILDAAAELFAEHGYGGTKLGMVAQRAGVSPRTVRRLTGGRDELFARVIATKLTSQAADRVAAAASDPEAIPPLAVLVDAAAQIFAAPEFGWSVLELEALTRAHRDDRVRELESARLAERCANMRAVVEQARRAGGLDDAVDSAALAHLALVISVGLAVLDPVSRRPTSANWNALMGRIGAAVAPVELLLATEHGNRKPWRLRVDIPDRPGALARLIRALSTLHAYVVATSVLAVDDGVRTIDLAVTVQEKVTLETLLAAAMSAGSNVLVADGSADDGLDLPTRVLDGAAELVTNPGSAPLAAAALVEADRFEVTGATEGEDDAAGVLRLQWTADRHVVLHRGWAPFARAEQTRASALLRLAAAIASSTGDAEALGWVEPVKDDGTVWIRLGRPEDADAVAAMHERCSERTRYRRYLAGVGEWRDLSMRRLAGGHRGATLVVMSEDGSIVGLGNVFPDEPGDAHTAELAELVEDAYQGRGIGTRLLRHMLELAQRLGFQSVSATVLAENAEMLAVMEATGLGWTREQAASVITMRAPLPVVESGSLIPGHSRVRRP
jgi:AcrR family transcriptional regulator/RimJ/RimL family protein N-acetyltransferase